MFRGASVVASILIHPKAWLCCLRPVGVVSHHSSVCSAYQSCMLYDLYSFYPHTKILSLSFSTTNFPSLLPPFPSHPGSHVIADVRG